jgi:hypothetical protein
MISFKRLVRRRSEDEGGFALVVVMTMAMVVLLAATVASATAINGADQAKTDSDWNGALAAASAGLQEYIFQVDQGTNYFQYNASNPDPTMTNSAGDNPFKSPTSATGWEPLPGAGAIGAYHWDVVNNTATNGTITLISTGWVGKSTRTVSAVLKQHGYLDYLYLTDEEIIDPILVNQSYQDCGGGSHGSLYHWSGRNDVNCLPVSFKTGDVLQGPVHSNDDLYFNGCPNQHLFETAGRPDGRRKRMSIRRTDVDHFQL